MSDRALASPFLDTNIFLRFVLDDSEVQSPACAELFRRIEKSHLQVQTSQTVVFEVVFTLQSFYKVPRGGIRLALLPLLDLDNIYIPWKELYREVFDLYVARRSLSFADAYHFQLATRLGCKQFVSFDRGFDKIPGSFRTTPDQVV